jgi:hypothetical protein
MLRSHSLFQVSFFGVENSMTICTNNNTFRDFVLQFFETGLRVIIVSYVKLFLTFINMMEFKNSGVFDIARGAAFRSFKFVNPSLSPCLEFIFCFSVTIATLLASVSLGRSCLGYAKI